MNEKYGIQVDKNKVNPSTEVKMEYQCVEEMTTEERKVYEEYEYILVMWRMSSTDPWWVPATSSSRNSETDLLVLGLEGVIPFPPVVGA